MTWDNKLWLYLNNKFLLEADNVISANILCCEYEPDGQDRGGISAKLYYLTTDGSLLCRYSDGTKIISTRCHNFTKILPSYQTLNLLANDKKYPYQPLIKKMNSFLMFGVSPLF